MPLRRGRLLSRQIDDDSYHVKVDLTEGLPRLEAGRLKLVVSYSAV